MNQLQIIAWPKDPRYLVTSEGKIIGPSGRVLKPRPHMHGYIRMSAIVGGKLKDFYVHRIVCETFHGIATAGMQVDHINRNRADNRPDNLRWVSSAENLNHRNHPIGILRVNTILSDDDVRNIRSVIGTQSSIAKQFGISREHVRDIRNGKARKYVS